MAQLDPSIFAALGTRPKSAFDYLKDMAEADQTRQQTQLQKLQLLGQQRAFDDAEQARGIRNRGLSAVQALGGGATDDQRISALRGVGDYGTADAIEKSMLERQKTGAAVQKDKADAEKTQLANLHSKIDRHLQGLATVNDPQAAMMWLKQGVNDGIMDMQKASSMVKQFQTMTPDQFQAWKQQAAAAGLSLKDQVEQHFKQLNFDQGARNDLIGPDGQVNQPLLNAKQQVAAASKTTVSVNTGQKGLENELHLRSDFRQEPVYKAHQEVQSAYQQIKAGIGQQSPAGDLAAATKIMKLLDPGSVVRESELGMAMAATGLLDRLTNYAQMRINGTKLTPDQRKDFQALADKLYSASVDQFNTKRDEYQKLGEGYGLNAGRALGPQGSAPKPSGGGKVVDFNSLKE